MRPANASCRACIAAAPIEASMAVHCGPYTCARAARCSGWVAFSTSSRTSSGTWISPRAAMGPEGRCRMAVHLSPAEGHRAGGYQSRLAPWSLSEGEPRGLGERLTRARGGCDDRLFDEVGLARRTRPGVAGRTPQGWRVLRLHEPGRVEVTRGRRSRCAWAD
jgi:hypothetical protein